ncbi:hypothetical protein BDV27DRAFT_136051, partial [Aspergillus caelatus]
MLRIWAEQVRSGQPMSYHLSLGIFGGPNGRDRRILENLISELNEREMNNTM